MFDQLFVSTTPLQPTVSIYWLVAVSTLYQCITLRNPHATYVLMSHRVSLVKPSPLQFRALHLLTQSQHSLFQSPIFWKLVKRNGPLKYSSFHRSHSLRMNDLRCTSEVQKCKFALMQPRSAGSCLHAISVAMEQWTAQHHTFVVEAYFKNGDSAVTTQRLFRRHFNIPRHGHVPRRNTIKNGYRTFGKKLRP